MHTIELFRWYLTCRDTGRRYRTRHLMSRADALSLDPLAKPVEGSREARLVPDGRSERAMTDAWRSQAAKPPPGLPKSPTATLSHQTRKLSLNRSFNPHGEWLSKQLGAEL